MVLRTKDAPPGLPLPPGRTILIPTISGATGSGTGSAACENAPSWRIDPFWLDHLGRSCVGKRLLEVNQPGRDDNEIIRLQDHVLFGLPLLEDIDHVQLEALFGRAIGCPAADYLHLLLVGKIAKAARA